MTPPAVTPLTAFQPDGPDADWAGVRDQLMASVTTTAPTTWTDHNAIEPGVTLAEAAAFGLADLHYRTATRVPAWPVEVPAWLPDEDRRWHATLPAGAAAIADLLAGPAPGGGGSVAAVLEPLVAACAAPNDALVLLAEPPWAGRFDARQTPVVVALLRARLVRRLAHELSDLVAAAVDAERATGPTGARPVAERDARAAAALATAVPLWPDELAALVRRERRRRTAATVLAALDAVRAAATPAAVEQLRGALAAQDLGTDEVAAALAAAPAPPGQAPEDLEDEGGASRVWPPHPLQALTCEPVTADDYARRARTHPQVGRAWAVPGRLVGVGWDGRAVTTPSQAAGAVTLVVERVLGAGPTAAFLRDVLAHAVGSEVRQPHPTWQDRLDLLDPRRLIGDEVGAALLATQLVTLQGRMVTGVGVDRQATVAAALDRVAGFLAAGRPESRPAPGAGPAVAGPWPRVDQPPDGWIPGEAIRFTEVVRVLVADPQVLGVEHLTIKVGGGDFVASSAGSVPLADGAIPRLADVQCLRVRYVLTTGTTGCSGA